MYKEVSGIETNRVKKQRQQNASQGPATSDPRQALAIDSDLGFVRGGGVPTRPAIPEDDACDDQAPRHGRRRRGAPAPGADKAARLRGRKRWPLVDVPEPRVGVRLALRMSRGGMGG